ADDNQDEFGRVRPEQRRIAAARLRLCSGAILFGTIVHRPVYRPSALGSSSSASTPICASTRFHACLKTRDRGPSMTASVISTPRLAGKQCSTIACGGALASSDSFTW